MYMVKTISHKDQTGDFNGLLPNEANVIENVWNNLKQRDAFELVRIEPSSKCPWDNVYNSNSIDNIIHHEQNIKLFWRSKDKMISKMKKNEVRYYYIKKAVDYSSTALVLSSIYYVIIIAYFIDRLNIKY